MNLENDSIEVFPLFEAALFHFQNFAEVCFQAIAKAEKEGPELKSAFSKAPSTRFVSNTINLGRNPLSFMPPPVFGSSQHDEHLNLQLQ